VRANWYNRCPPELQLALRQHIAEAKRRRENGALRIDNIPDDWRTAANAPSAAARNRFSGANYADHDR